MKNFALLALAALALTACPSTPRPVLTDAGGGGTDTGPGTDAGPGVDTGSGGGTDSGPRVDGGGSDPCAAAMAAAVSTVGCNGGFLTGEPAANAPGGTCTGSAAMAGSCTGTGAVCADAMGVAAAGAPGVCYAFCMSGGTYVSNGGCPTGFRCFDLTMADVCFRDCDTTHMCPTGMMCDDEGSCVEM